MPIIRNLLQQCSEADMSYAIEGSRVEYVGPDSAIFKLKKGDKGTVYSLAVYAQKDVKLDKGGYAKIKSYRDEYDPQSTVNWKLLPGPRYETPKFSVLVSTKNGGTTLGSEGFKYYGDAMKYAKAQAMRHGGRAVVRSEDNKIAIYFDGNGEIDHSMTRGLK